MICLYCQKEFNALSDKRRKFCSRSCASKFNNPKTLSEFTPCIDCNKSTKRSSSGAARKFCNSCYKKKFQYAGDMTIEEASYLDKGNSNRYRKIRHHAHEIASKFLIEQKCSKCDYDKHVELAHIKAISSFPVNTKLSVVNSTSNLVWLCPNCHWEFDNAPATN